MRNNTIVSFCLACVQVERELKILRLLEHEGLVSYNFSVDEGARISIVMDWAGEGLREHRTLTHPNEYSEAAVRHMVYQLTTSLAYLHQKVGLLHCYVMVS